MKYFKLSTRFVLVGCVLLASAIFFGCSNNVTTQETSTTINGRGIRIYIIDSCEYIGYVYGGYSDILSHKGNCKFCAKRNNN